MINLKGYEISLHWTGGEENLFDYILYSMDFAPFVTLAGTVSALSMMRFDGTMDEAVMFRMGNRKKYFRHKWLCSALIISAWTAVVLLLRIMAGVAVGYGIQGNPDGGGAVCGMFGGVFVYDRLGTGNCKRFFDRRRFAECRSDAVFRGGTCGIEKPEV